MSSKLPFDIDVDATQSLMTETDVHVFLLDCRTQAERDIGHIADSVFIPMDQLPNRINELPAEEEGRRLIVYCHLGGRSAMVTEWLRTNGFESAQNMSGGIDAWSMKIDPTIERYS